MEPKGKEPYEKPEVAVIALEAEQVLAVGCKTPSPQVNVGVPACGLGVPCSSNGS